MKHLWSALCAILLVNGARAAERPWQEIVMPSAAEAAAGFQTPPPENGMVLWWGWDGPVTAEVITRDLDRVKAMGFTGVMIEAGYQMSAPYLSPGWFDLIRTAVEQARRRDLRVWVEDEGKYPSGFVGGKFTRERPDLCMQALFLGERIEAAGGQPIARKLAPETICAVACNLENGGSRVLDIRSGELRWAAPEGKWEIRTVEHRFHTGPTRSVNNPTRGKDTSESLCDYLNPAATRQILAWTHEQYKQAVGNEFGRTFMGFMGDEPDFAGIPWTPNMLEEFQKRKGYDVRPCLAWFFSSSMPDEARRAKADYWDVWSDLFGESYFKVLADWCAANRCEYIVHLNNEDRNAAFVRSGGDFFKNMRHVAIPGIDVIWSQIWMDHEADYPKLASSAAHLFGRPHAFTESFAAFTVRPNLEQAKWVIDYQLVRGINSVQVMFMRASTTGGGMGRGATPGAGPGLRRGTGVDTSTTAGLRGARGAGPGAGGGGGMRGSFFQTPEFPAVAQYVHRASYLLSLGRPAAQIGLYMPTTSLWLGDTEADKSNLAIARQLLERQRDFDWVDEQALSSVLTLDGGALKNLSGQAYRAIIIPSVTALSGAALERLRKFSEAGGCVIFAGRVPSLLVEKTFRNAPAFRLDRGWAFVEPSGGLTTRVLEALPKPDVALDQPCPAVKVLHRRWRDADLYFFFNESATTQSRTAVLAGNGQMQVWDAAAGKIETLADASSENGAVRAPLALGPHETKFLVIGPRPSGGSSPTGPSAARINAR